ncbi:MULTISPECIES: FMN-dependent NADH-azoreductase [unclassified Frigoribacterium]|uniref:FMN-dependent NADH-azoreductase n=1 Tax=unclassified Frigoribacterium TaxID=2627005 RepID=UPI0006F56DD0|nr:MULTISPECIES: NAD(P)H-dependent oxidoreductase [unclassified Frigoribacterium]KQO81708.1 FMN-dependent NADH-azoreductase [Frigoribacterium sp. Leaf263]KQR66054.1 FMN-dependent NADH-azoreductase [Frigoribacterium sp. Leaf172]
MPELLHIDSSADLATSRSRAITGAFADAWRDLGDDHTITRRDLHVDQLPHLSDSALHWPPRLRQPGDAPDPAHEALQQTLIAELIAADVVLIGAPLYNYSVPSTLKAWIDNIHLPAVTAPFDGDDQQPLAGRPAVIVTSRGGVYDVGTDTEGWDHATPVLDIILGKTLGMSLEVIATNLTLSDRLPMPEGSRERAEREFAEATRAAVEAARRLG